MENKHNVSSGCVTRSIGPQRGLSKLFFNVKIIHADVCNNFIERETSVGGGSVIIWGGITG